MAFSGVQELQIRLQHASDLKTNAKGESQLDGAKAPPVATAAVLLRQACTAFITLFIAFITAMVKVRVGQG